jgi:hypothetical protein
MGRDLFQQQKAWWIWVESCGLQEGYGPCMQARALFEQGTFLG